MIKRLLIISTSLLLCTNVYAQRGQSKNALTLDEIVQQHKQELANGITEKIGKEAKDAHFQRWLWYAQQHTDQDGYVVSDKRRWDEWQKFETERARSKSTAHSMADWKPFVMPALSKPQLDLGNGIGRINIIEFHPTVANTYYVGAVSGGVWKTTNNGQSWTCLTDNQPVMTVSDIDVDPQNANTIYVCTGDRDGADETWNHYSIGILKSTDGGANWASVGPVLLIKNKQTTNSLVINPSNSNSLTLAMNDGIYKSADAGANWTQVMQNADVKQLLYKPGDTSIMYAASAEDANDYAQVYRSLDGGNTWNVMTNIQEGLRAVLAVSPADPNLVLALFAETDNVNNNSGGLLGLYKSTNNGATFSQLYTHNNCMKNILSGEEDETKAKCGGQGGYDIAMAISPTNANNVFVGGVNGWVSTDGGVSWTVNNQWYPTLPGIATVHADKHWLAFHPLVPGRLFECNDGGVAYSDNATNKNGLWTNVTNGMNITQFYRIGVGNSNKPDTKIAGGAQDNSIYVFDAATKAITMVGTGDGTNAHIDEVNDVVYCTEQNGHLHRVDVNGDNIISPAAGGPWTTSFKMSPFNRKHLIAGYDIIYYSEDQGNSWKQVSNGPLVGAGKWIYRVEMTPASASTIYATMEGTDDIYYTHSFIIGSTATFTKLNTPNGGNITDIELDPKDKDHFWVTLGGYGSDQVLEYKSGNWTQMNAGLPDVPVLCVRLDTNNQNLYVGTDLGVFFREPMDTKWESFGKGLPKTNVTDLEINYVTNKIYAGTYGRGIWESPRQGAPGSVATVPFARDVFQVAPNPNKGKFSIVVGDKVTAADVKLTVRDYTGRVVSTTLNSLKSSKQINVSLGNAPAGIYIVELSDEHVVLGSKQVIVR